MEEARRLALEQYHSFSQRRIEEGDALAEKEFEQEVKKMLAKGPEDNK
jgi:hypothetical protein